MKKKGQSAIEFIILIGGMILFSLAFIYSVQINIAEKTSERKNLVVREIALSVQGEINLAGDSLDGYYREFDIPLNVLGDDYEIDVSEGFVFVRTNDGKYATSYSILDVDGNVIKGNNVIEKENGVIYFNR